MSVRQIFNGIDLERDAKTSPDVLKAWELGDVPENQKWVKLEDAQKVIVQVQEKLLSVVPKPSTEAGQ